VLRAAARKKQLVHNLVTPLGVIVINKDALALKLVNIAPSGLENIARLPVKQALFNILKTRRR
jgi:hypothetical protein